MDLQAISDANNAHKYIMGYNFKMEDDATTHRRVEELIARLSREGDIDAHDVYRIAHAALQGRSTSTFEACHLLLGEPVVQFSRDNVWIQTSRPEEWTVAVPRHEEVAALENPSDYAQMHHRMPALLQHYSDLQKDNPAGGSEIDLPVEGGSRRTRVAWGDLTFFDFVAGLRITSRDGTLEVMPRNKPAIVGHRNYSPDTQPEDFYYAKLLLHTVWARPGDWLRDVDEGSHARAFHRLLSEDAIYLGSQCYPNYNGSLTTARELFKVQAEMYLRGQMEGNEAEEHYRGTLGIMEQLRLRCGTQIDMDVPDYVDTTSWNIGFGRGARRTVCLRHAHSRGEPVRRAHCHAAQGDGVDCVGHAHQWLQSEEPEAPPPLAWAWRIWQIVHTSSRCAVYSQCSEGCCHCSVHRCSSIPSRRCHTSFLSWTTSGEQVLWAARSRCSTSTGCSPSASQGHLEAHRPSDHRRDEPRVC